MYCDNLSDIFCSLVRHVIPFTNQLFFCSLQTDENAYFLHQILQELYEVNRDSSWKIQIEPWRGCI